MTFKGPAPREEMNDTVPARSSFSQALELFHEFPTKKTHRRIAQGTRAPFLAWEDEPILLPPQERNLASETFFGKRSDICVVNGSDYNTFLKACKKAKALPTRLFGIATVIRGHGGFDLHIRPELPKIHLSTLGDIASFIGLFPRGVPDSSAYFTFYLGEIDARIQWRGIGKWHISIAPVRTIGKRAVGQKHAHGSKILHPIIRISPNT